MVSHGLCHDGLGLERPIFWKVPGLGMSNINFLIADVIDFFIKYNDYSVIRGCNKNQICVIVRVWVLD